MVQYDKIIRQSQIGLHLEKTYLKGWMIWISTILIEKLVRNEKKS
ncbi:MAG: hypothetical protein K0R93_3609 [Anaerosolibacter sp.]|jgi:hypothetical protein|nr:hypothetical protein [Anaerosolibacter sp.]